MKSIFLLSSIALLSTFLSIHAKETKADDGWVAIFNGKDLSGWTASENKGSCTVKDGKIVLFGPRSHLFYTGKVNEGTFKNFELKAEVMTTPGSNSGIYFHTRFQEKGWPGKGYEAQVNNTHNA